MIKRVHFVDKPFEHVLKCSPYSDDPAGKNRRSWELMRGKPIDIEFPMIHKPARQYAHYTCQGPFYWRQFMGTKLDSAVCIHLIDWLAK